MMHVTKISLNKHRVTIDKKYKWIHFEVTITSTRLVGPFLFSDCSFLLDLFSQAPAACSVALVFLSFWFDIYPIYSFSIVNLFDSIIVAPPTFYWRLHWLSPQYDFLSYTIGSITQIPQYNKLTSHYRFPPWILDLKPHCQDRSHSHTPPRTIPTSQIILDSIPTLNGGNNTTTIGKMIPNPVDLPKPSIGRIKPWINGTICCTPNGGYTSGTITNTIIEPSTQHPSLSIPFMKSLNITYSKRFTNGFIHHYPSWHPI